MNPAYATKLGFTTRKTNVGAQKIDGLPLGTHNMVSAVFSLQGSQERVRFFEITFLLAGSSIEMVLKILFLALSKQTSSLKPKVLPGDPTPLQRPYL